MIANTKNSAKAYSYIRFSTPEQRSGDSLRRQTEAAAQYAERHGLELDDGLTFADTGVSAFRGRNIEEGRLGAFIKAVDTGLVSPGSYLLVESLDRLSRDRIMQALELVQSLLQKGITIVTLSDKKVYTEDSLNNLPDLMFSLMIMSRAHEESAMKALRMKSAWKGKREKARSEGKPLTSTVPNWLRLNKDVEQFEVHEHRAEIVRRIYSMYLDESLGKVTIAGRLNEEGVPTFSERAKSWHHSYIGRVLTNGAVIGRFQPTRYEVKGGKRHNVPDGPEIEDYYPAVIDRETFFRAQRQRMDRGLSSGPRGEGFSNLFRGIAKCGTCGGTMHYISKGKRWKTSKHTNAYLQCANARRKANGCDHSALWPYHAVEYFVTEGISDIDFAALFPSITEASRTALETASVQLDAAQGELKEVSGKVQNAAQLLIERHKSRALRAAMDTLEQRQGELEQTVERLEGDVNEARAQLASVESRFRDQEEALEQWRESRDGAELRSKLNRSLTANIERMEFHPLEDDPKDLSYIRHIFKQGDRNWTLGIWRGEKRGEFEAHAQPFNREDSYMADGGEHMWFPEGTGPGPGEWDEPNGPSVTSPS